MASKTAVWRAVNSIHGDRLVEITQEHIQLSKKLTDYMLAQRSTDDDPYIKILKSQIEKLRMERDRIITLYGGGVD